MMAGNRDKKTRHNYRMYGLVNYQLSDIQKGIQFGHAVVEYSNMIWKGTLTKKPELYKAYKQWALKDKTFIILNGGTTNTSEIRPGTLNEHRLSLRSKKVPLASFFEPDLGDQLTAVVFLVDDRVFDRRKYPDFEQFKKKNFAFYSSEKEIARAWKNQFDCKGAELNRILWLRDFLKHFKLA